MTTKQANAICLGGPCHGTLLHVDGDGDHDGDVLVPLPAAGGGTADYHVTGERIHHGSCPHPVIVLHWNHAIAAHHCAGPAEGKAAGVTVRFVLRPFIALVPVSRRSPGAGRRPLAPGR